MEELVKQLELKIGVTKSLSNKADPADDYVAVTVKELEQLLTRAKLLPRDLAGKLAKQETLIHLLQERIKQLEEKCKDVNT